MIVGYCPERRPIWLLAKMGCFEISRDGLRFRWGELSLGWGVAAELILFEDHWSFKFHPLYGAWYIKLPRSLPHREPHEMMESWGFSWRWGRGDGDLHLRWGQRSKVLFWPLGWKHHLTEIQRKDGTWRPRKSARLDGGEYDSAHKPLPDVHIEQHPYHYMLPSGEVQHVTATVTMERSTLRLVKWLPWPRKVVYGIDVWFSDEVGERAGSWKGGCLGCGCTMRRGETMRDTLRRMQRERRFS